MPSPRRREPPTLKPAAFMLLLCLVEGELHGYALKKAARQRSGGRVDLGPATLYRTLESLLADGLIAESDRRPVPELDDERRRYYRLTPLGRRAAEAEAGHLAHLVGEARAVRLLAG